MVGLGDIITGETKIYGYNTYSVVVSKATRSIRHVGAHIPRVSSPLSTNTISFSPYLLTPQQALTVTTFAHTLPYHPTVIYILYMCVFCTYNKPSLSLPLTLLLPHKRETRARRKHFLPDVSNRRGRR